MHTSIVLPPESVGPTRLHAALLLALTVAVAGCGAGDGGEARRSGDPDEQMEEAAEGAPVSTPVPATSDRGRVVRKHPGDGAVLEHSAFILDDCGCCPRGPDTDWRSAFSNSFLGEGESCTYAPSKLVDGDRRTGWAEGDEGDGIGADVVIPQLLDLTGPIRIWAGYAKSPELFAANDRPKRVQVTVLRVRAAEPDPRDATGCSTATYVEPVVVAGPEVDLRDCNGYQALPVPEFRRESIRVRHGCNSSGAVLTTGSGVNERQPPVRTAAMPERTVPSPRRYTERLSRRGLPGGSSPRLYAYRS